MGVFLGAPIVDELKDCLGAADVAAAARRCLEVLVPLVYRPAMKVRCTYGRDICVTRRSLAEL